jgi:glycerol uptake facilitator-like aquaporin
VGRKPSLTEVADPQPSEPATAEHPLSRRLVAEALGAFSLVFVAVGADAMAEVSGGAVSAAARAVAPALMVGALIYAIGDVSGAHFNPVVTAAFALKRLFPPRLVLGYWLAQLIGGVVAALTVQQLFGGALRAGVSTPHVDPSAAVAIEAILTMLLLIVILGTADRARVVGADAALAVAATIALAGLIALPIEGASMNPVRSLAPAFVAGDASDVWIYVLGPVLGGLIALGINLFLHGPHAEDAKARDAAQGES